MQESTTSDRVPCLSKTVIPDKRENGSTNMPPVQQEKVLPEKVTETVPLETSAATTKRQSHLVEIDTTAAAADISTRPSRILVPTMSNQSDKHLKKAPQRSKKTAAASRRRRNRVVRHSEEVEESSSSSSEDEESSSEEDGADSEKDGERSQRGWERRI